ncbi:MAG: hypothetical protein NTZ56_11550 [Acidobacteria bacterium]|nr:hypothetical protein [Acidobacteriota bacterium]
MTIEIPDEDVLLAEQKLDGNGLPLEKRLAVFIHDALLTLQPVTPQLPTTRLADLLVASQLSRPGATRDEVGGEAGLQVRTQAVTRIRQRGALHSLPEGETIEGMIREGRA